MWIMNEANELIKIHNLHGWLRLPSIEVTKTITMKTTALSITILSRNKGAHEFNDLLWCHRFIECKLEWVLVMTS